MAQLKELLEKEELEHIKEVKEDIIEENSNEGITEVKSDDKSEKGSNAWIWVAAIVAAIIILK